MVELYQDNLFEIRKYLDNTNFLNSLLVCKEWSQYYYKEKKQRVLDAIQPIILNHGFRHKMLSITKYMDSYGRPYYGICIYKGKKCAFYCPYSFKDAEKLWINHADQFWGPFNKLLPVDFSFSESFNIPPDYDHYLTARVNLKDYHGYQIDYLIRKHKYSNTFHVIEGNDCDITVYETPDTILEKLEETIDWDIIKDLKVIDYVHFEECNLEKIFRLHTVFTLCN